MNTCKRANGTAQLTEWRCQDDQCATRLRSWKSSCRSRCMMAMNVSRSCSVRIRGVVRSMYWPSWLQATARGTPAARAAHQPAAAPDKVAFVLPGHPGQLDHEDPGPDLVDKPEVTHLDCSTIARRRRMDMPAGLMIFPLLSNAGNLCETRSAELSTGGLPCSQRASPGMEAGENAGRSQQLIIGGSRNCPGGVGPSP